MEEGGSVGVVRREIAVEEFRQTVGGHEMEGCKLGRREIGCGLYLSGGKKSWRAVARDMKL